MPESEERRRAWHRIFGVVLTDLFAGTPFDVELEKDLSMQQQFLDGIVVRKRPGAVSFRLPDGFDELTDHNLITYKSMNEALDDWTLKELTGFYVSYRKQLGGDNLVPEDRFRMFGVSTRYPQKLAKEVELIKKQNGVYEARRGSDVIRIIVLREIPPEEHNAFWNLFSAIDDMVKFGTEHYKFKFSKATTALLQLFGQYQLEGLNMPYTVEQFYEETQEKMIREYLRNIDDDKRKELLKTLLAGMTLDEVKQYLTNQESDEQSNGESKNKE